MAKGSFNGLYTFEDIAKIYKMDSSTLRKMVQHEKFIIDKDIKKFGKTWLITEEAVNKYFGLGMLQLHTKELTLELLRQKREDKIKKAALKSANKKTRKTKDDVFSMDSGSDDGPIEYIREIVVDEKDVLQTFSFGTRD